VSPKISRKKKRRLIYFLKGENKTIFPQNKRNLSWKQGNFKETCPSTGLQAENPWGRGRDKSSASLDPKKDPRQVPTPITNLFGSGHCGKKEMNRGSSCKAVNLGS